jgi:hypothetical protein
MFTSPSFSHCPEGHETLQLVTILVLYTLCIQEGCCFNEDYTSFYRIFMIKLEYVNVDRLF